TSPYLAGLRRLDLSHNKIGTRGVKALAASEHLAGLRELLLGYDDAGAGEQGVAAIAASPHLVHLEELEVPANDIGLEGAQALVTAPFFPNLTQLALGRNGLFDDVALLLADQGEEGAPLMLSLYGNYLTDEGACALAESPLLDRLTGLDLYENEIG